jgi:hypothetical protein
MMKAIVLTITTSLTPVAVLFISSYWSGWRRLAVPYGYQGKFSARQRWTFVTGKMGMRVSEPLLKIQSPLFSFRSCLTISVNETGMHLSLFPLFRLFHPPIFIPWSHISAEVSPGVLSTWVEFYFRGGSAVCLLLRERIAREVLMYSPMQISETN